MTIPLRLHRSIPLHYAITVIHPSYSDRHEIHRKVSSPQPQASRRCIFSDVSHEPAEIELLFRLIHFWEARNIAKGKTFIGLELLQYDEQGTVMHEFISSTRAPRCSPHPKAKTTYSLLKF
ncbi:hypothetical protein YC2023_040327 [Brassica napus]|uniref:(rape) hypothetical protein n=1 Tax=Brassica napus TaxID=3708 RepID=A0A816IE56_BRANA|nr:unnamed protein product [Brassica napus]